MAEIVNLRRARKAKARAEKDTTAQANRAAHGVSKSARKLARALDEKAINTLSGHKLEPDK